MSGFSITDVRSVSTYSSIYQSQLKLPTVLLSFPQKDEAIPTISLIKIFPLNLYFTQGNCSSSITRHVTRLVSKPSYSSIQSFVLRSSERERSVEMSTSDDIRVEVWTRDPTRLSQVVGGTLRGSGTVSRESREADWGVTSWLKLASEATEEDVSKTSWGVTERDWCVSPRGRDEKRELVRFELMKFSFRWAAWGWGTLTGGQTRVLFSATDWEQEGRALDEACFIRKASKSLKGGFDDSRFLWRATWFVWDVAGVVREAVQAGVVSSADIRGGESPQNKEWGVSSVVKESEWGAVTK